MKLTLQSGHALVIYEGEVHTASFKNTRYGYEFTLSNGLAVNPEDYEDRLDAYYYHHGDAYHYVTHVLAEAANAADLPSPDEFRLPDQAEINTQMVQQLMPVIQAANAGKIYSDEIGEAQTYLTTMPFLYSRWKKTGDVAAAQKLVINDCFSI